MSAHRQTIRFSAQAHIDFEDILVFAERQWGDTQADAYAETLRNALDTLCEYPSLGRKRDDLGPGLRSFPVAQHVAYYHIGGDTLHIRRIVHRRQEIDDADSL